MGFLTQVARGPVDLLSQATDGDYPQNSPSVIVEEAREQVKCI